MTGGGSSSGGRGDGDGDVPSGARDTDSLYDDFIHKVARAPSVDPELLQDVVRRSEQESLAGKQLAHFKVIDRLGAGGMGVVYRAEDERLRRRVALKVLSIPLHGEQRNQWLLGEARNAAAVNHPNIAAIYEVGETQGLAFIAMEYVEGQSLRTLLAQGGLPVEQALELGVQIAQGLARAHQCGIVHRDLKPDNVMVGPDGFVKILDFGLAVPLAALQEGGRGAGREGEGPLPRPGAVVGTVAYMSPEQARGEPVDARTDVYSFGVLLFELISGQRPRASAAREEALALSQPGAPGALVEGLRRVLARCLEPRAEARYPSGAELVDALGEVLQERAAARPGIPESSPRARLLRRWMLLAVMFLGGGGAIFVVLHPELFIPEPPPPDVHERRLTANPPENLLVDAALSPDAKVLAYTDQKGLYLRNIEPEQTRLLSLPEQSRPESVDWFGNGAELLVTSGGPGTRSKQVWRLRVATGKAELLGEVQCANIRISRDGTMLAWTDYREIRVGPLDLSSSRAVASAREDEYLIKPSWSPDGRWLAYVRNSQLTTSLETVSLETGEHHVLLETLRLQNGMGESALAWAASGELVYALSDLPPKEVGFSLWRQDVDLQSGKVKGRPRLIHDWSGFYPDLLSVGGNGRLALARFETQVDVYIAEVSDGGRRMSPPRRFTLSERNEFPSGWSPDGQTLLFSSDRDGTNDIFLQKLDGSPFRKVTAGSDFKTWPAFTPAGDEILFWRYPWPPDEHPRRAELVRLSLSSGSIAQVLTSETLSGSTWDLTAPFKAHFRCAPRGGNCVLGEQEGTQLVFYALDPRWGRGKVLGQVEVLNKGFHSWDLSPDGQRIALPGRVGELRIVELSSGKVSHRAVASECELKSVTWSSDGLGLFATGSCQEGKMLSKVLHIGPDGAADVLWMKDSTWFSRIMASPDGRYLAISVRPVDNDVWLITGI